ncbi:MAG TPA: hypothetical protein VGX70_22205 [Gemmataceae bacterium]|jgi:hypothetical protein|nr:hypothetical protein [Gemmataceae bacterium]
MNRTLPWLAALICAGWISSSAHAWHPFAGRRGACTTCATDQTVPPAAPAAQTATDQNGPTNGAIVDGGAGCRTGALGALAGIPQKVASCARDVNQWILNVPQKTPPPPKPLPINPYTRSPRDYFMVGDP